MMIVCLIVICVFMLFQVDIVRSPLEPETDLVIMENADFFIGNCVSYFTAFVVRARRLSHKPVEFFVFKHLAEKDEL